MTQNWETLPMKKERGMSIILVHCSAVDLICVCIFTHTKKYPLLQKSSVLHYALDPRSTDSYNIIYCLECRNNTTNHNHNPKGHQCTLWSPSHPSSVGRERSGLWWGVWTCRNVVSHTREKKRRKVWAHPTSTSVLHRMQRIIREDEWCILNSSAKSLLLDLISKQESIWDEYKGLTMTSLKLCSISISFACNWLVSFSTYCRK